MAEGEFDSAVRDSHVFARIEPDTKQRIVESLRRMGEYVSMVGDGVNDVPALKEADLAIVMNDGTQISKDVADIVLLNNAMSTLPRAFREGKETTQTIFGTMKMFLVRNFFMVALFVCIAFMSLPFPITPVQISWATFGTVNLPATLIAFGWLRPRFMAHFRRDVLDYIITMGCIGAAVMTLLYLIVWFGGDGDLTPDALGDDDHGRAVWHADHLAYPGHRFVQSRFFPAALAHPAAEQRIDGADDHRHVPLAGPV